MARPPHRHEGYTHDQVPVQHPAERRRLVDGAYGLIAYQARLLFDAYLEDNETHRQVLLEGNMRAKDTSIVIENRVARAALPAPPSTAEFAQLLRQDVDEAGASRVSVNQTH